MGIKYLHTLAGIRSITRTFISMPQGNDDKTQIHWFVMRDLKRSNAKCRAYQWLTAHHFEVFTPMKWEVILCRGKRIRRCVPFMPDLLFVHSSREALDSVVEATPTLQYRYVRGAASATPMIICEAEMNRFIHAVKAVEEPRYFSPSEVTPAMLGRRIRVVGGNLDGCEGRLLARRGSRKRHLLVEIPSVLVASVEVEAEYIELVSESGSETSKSTH